MDSMLDKKRRVQKLGRRAIPDDTASFDSSDPLDPSETSSWDESAPLLPDELWLLEESGTRMAAVVLSV